MDAKGMTMPLPDPMDKPLESDDPMLLRGQPVTGDPQVMLECLVEEFASMGWDADRIEKLFDMPFFRATHGLAEHFGRDGVRSRIEATLNRCGVHRFETAHVPDSCHECGAEGETSDG